MKTKALIIGTVVFIGLTGNISAQKDTSNSYTENVMVVGSYDPRLMDFPKKEFNPVFTAEEVKKTDMKYSVFAQPMKISFLAAPIKAAKMSGEPFTELYGNYIRVGFGTGRTPYGELFVNTKRNKTKSFGLHMKHFSTNGKIPDYGFSGMSNNEVDLFGSRIKSKNTIYSKLFFHSDIVHYYGFMPDSLISPTDPNVVLLTGKKDIKQRYNDAGAMISFYSTHADSTHVNYKTDLNYHCFWNIHNATENSIALDGYLDKRVGWLKKVSKHQVVGLRYDVEHYFQNRGFMAWNEGLVNIAPYINTNFGPVFIEFAPKLAMETDSTAEAYFFPEIKLELNLLPGTLSAFGGLDGDLKYHSFRLLANENPFIHHFVRSDYSRTTQMLYGGIRGNIAHAFSYSIQAINRKIENCPMFAIDDSISYLENQMTVVYDEKVNWFRGEFNGALNIGNKWKGLLMVAYNQADAVTNEKAYNIPDFEGMIGLSYNLADKILASARVFYIGQRYAKISYGDIMTLGSFAAIEPVKLNPAIDANLTLEYRYSKVLSAYLEFSNIASQRYMLWNHYPSYRFRFMGGVTYSF
ncbi:MAG: hypothetical protein A2W93_03275 [Bacteroidetes bacterium GWF2_43_63]|nr:MAG: hypothetical protein A2W94_09275 [Bacteroidetes bacterium GWE2_42_42]OFY53681.1 MAG: hypothetical protein A2W93_03275 [Bacteroidetes bacterium GWF2_43_63]HCB62936.1 hypothetical protein [Bacteroidales bacterium]HCY24300.1 hypothetical protein [Bacteroidales bacterium]